MQITGKKALRTELLKKRRAMDRGFKALADRKIADRVISSDTFNSSEDILVYVSSDIEVGTRLIIGQALSDKKSVFCPRCIAGGNEMVFCRISSFGDLEAGSYGILEPKSYCEHYSQSRAAVCIAPALAFDPLGFRLGFGKGYYDRFLSGFTGAKLGICYDSFILDNVFRDSFDVPVDIIFTENRELNSDDKREE